MELTAKTSTKLELKKFCDETSIHGLIFINGKKAVKWKRRLLWLVIFFVAISLLVWQSSSDIGDYLQFDVQTTVEHKYPKDGLKFPAVTICPANIFRRSVLGDNDFLMAAITQIFGANGVNYTSRLLWNKQMCPSTAGAASPELKGPIAMLLDLGLDGAMIAVGMPSQLSVVGCWWNENELENCSSMFYNHFTQYFLCYTINAGTIDNEIADVLALHRNDSISEPAWTALNVGPRYGLRILLNANQDEYCGMFEGRLFGAGFRLFIHDQSESIGILSSTTDIYIQPGRSYNVAVKPVEFNRETESLGKCNKTVTVENFNEQADYLHSICITLCYVKFIVTKCHCIPVMFAEAVLNINKMFSTKWSVCRSTIDVLKFTNETVHFFHNTPSICVECLRQCSEIVYYPSVSEASLLTGRNLKKWHQSLNVTDAKHVNKNYVLLNIYFESFLIVSVREYQQISFQDLWINLGNNIGLYLGMSFMSLFEPVFALLIVWHIFILHWCVKMFDVLRRSKVLRMRKHVSKQRIRIKKLRTGASKPVIIRRAKSTRQITSV